MAFALNKELHFLIRQFCDEENLPKTVHMFEQETGCFFDMNYFEGLVLNGNWNEAESYLSGFTTLKDNLYSRKIYFEMRKQNYLEALDTHDVAAALEILRKDLKAFASSNAELYKEMALLLTMEDFRTYHSLSHYGDVTSARKHLMNEIRTSIEANPEFNKKLEFPLVEKSRLRRLVNQSLNWQHAHCAYPRSEPQVKTLFSDHKCCDQSMVQNPLPSRSMSAGSSSSSSAKFIALPPVPELDVFPDVPLECITDSGDVSNGNSDISMNEESIWEQMASLQSKPVPNQNPKSNIPVSLPTTIERCINVGASPNSIDFHPDKETVILVGSSVGDIELWDVGPETKLFRNTFVIWDREVISSTILDNLDKDPSVSVNRVLWCPDGSLFGVAHSKHIVHLYSYNVKTSYTEKHLEIVAHFGGINDLAFSSPEGKLLVITCGDDKLIQVWDTVTGSKQYTFEGHGDSVYSLCPHVKEDIHFLFSTSTNGDIKAWLFDDTRPKVHYTAPGHSCMRMAYSADGHRLFSCGTNKAGESFIVEWDESDGYIIQMYNGLSGSSAGVVQFSTCINRFLAAGDEHVIKIWDVDNIDVLAVIDAGGDLPASPCICFNKTGTLLAVSADTTKIKILANDVEHRQNSLCLSYDIHVNLSKSLKKLDINSAAPTGVRADDEMLLMGEYLESPVRVELNGVLGSQKRSTILDVSSCRSLRLPSDAKTSKICRLTYTNSGNGIVALAADGIHLVWRWTGHDSTKYGRATTNYPPQQCRQKSGLLMINDLNDDGVQSVSSCFALSKNDSYIVSGSGRTVSVFNTVTFKKMRSCILPPSIATCIAFYPPDNNIIVIGMDDSTILIYNVRLAEITNRLKGHTKPITGFAFSTKFEVLVSSGFDTQLIVWDYTTWEKKDNTLLDIPSNWSHVETSETTVQFLQDQKHFLAVHATQLVIYETTKLERVQQWMIGNFCTRISHATISSDNDLVYALMKDGIVLILNASDLSPSFEINPYVYLPSDISSRVEPIVVASNPQKPNQFALGLTDGGVIVIEPHELQGKWTL